MSTRDRRINWTPRDYSERPRDYDPELADKILLRLENGGDLVTICEEDYDLPLPGTFVRWTREEPQLGEEYAAAVSIRSDVLFDEALRLADGDDAARARVQTQIRTLHAERMVPEKYGPRTFNSTKPTREPEIGGVDHGAELRRRLDEMAKRAADPA